MLFFLLPFLYVSWRFCTVVSLENAFVPLKNYTVWIDNLNAVLDHNIVSIWLTQPWFQGAGNACRLGTKRNIFLEKEYFSIFSCSATFTGIFEKEKGWEVSWETYTLMFSHLLICVSDFFYFPCCPERWKTGCDEWSCWTLFVAAGVSVMFWYRPLWLKV